MAKNGANQKTRTPGTNNEAKNAYLLPSVTVNIR